MRRSQAWSGEACSRQSSQPGQRSCFPPGGCWTHPSALHRTRKAAAQTQGIQPHWRMRRRHSSPAAPSAHEPTAELSPSHRPAAAATSMEGHALVRAQAEHCGAHESPAQYSWRGIGRQRQAVAAAAAAKAHHSMAPMALQLQAGPGPQAGCAAQARVAAAAAPRCRPLAAGAACCCSLQPQTASRG